MADKIELELQNREILGKKVRFLRNQGVVPVHLFGHNLDSQALQGEAATLNKVISQAGKTRLIDLKLSSSPKTHSVMVKEVQKDPIRGNLLHVDFYQVNMAEKIKVEVPVVITGDSPALKIRENMLFQTLNSLSIECLPDKMPDKIEVDISEIKEVDQTIHVKDISLPDISIMNDPDLVIVKVGLRPVEVVGEGKPVPAAEGAEPAAGAEGETKA